MQQVPGENFSLMQIWGLMLSCVASSLTHSEGIWKPATKQNGTCLLHTLPPRPSYSAIQSTPHPCSSAGWCSDSYLSHYPSHAAQPTPATASLEVRASIPQPQQDPKLASGPLTREQAAPIKHPRPESGCCSPGVVLPCCIGGFGEHQEVSGIVTACHRQRIIRPHWLAVKTTSLARPLLHNEVSSIPVPVLVQSFH